MKRSVKTVRATSAPKIVRGSRLDGDTIAKMPVGQLRKMATQMVRMDGWISALTGAGTVRDKKEYAHFIAPSQNWRENVDLWRGDGLAGRIVELLPDEMTREGWDLCVDKDPAHDISKKVKGFLEEFEFDQKLHQALCLERAVGGAGTVMGVTGASGTMEEPLDLDHVTGLGWCETFEPLELQVSKWQNDPQLPHFGKPEMYRFQAVSPGGVKRGDITSIHASRVLKFPGIVVSRRQITAQMGWGDATLTRCRATIRDFQTAWGAIGHLIAEYGLAVWKIKNLAEIIALDKDKELKTRIEMMQMAMSAVNAVVLDAELEDFDRKQVPLTGLSDIMREFGSRLAADAGTPMTLLFGMSPGGMNATGEYDSRAWYDKVHANQVHRLKPKIEQACRIAFRALEIEEPGDWYVKFRPLLKPSEKEQAETRKTQSEVDKAYVVDMGILGKEEVRSQRFGGREFSYTTHVTGPIPVEIAATDPAAALTTPDGVAIAPPPAGARESLTGIQISSMMAIVQSVAKGELDRERGKAVLLASFPSITDQQADGMLGAAKAIAQSVAKE